nr:hypothetical protein [Kibdelosporangium sp. MJ126-NF4]CTQ88378.1 hypothetical protein [Kibdelosporangium sp. MJ126-NF4]
MWLGSDEYGLVFVDACGEARVRLSFEDRRHDLTVTLRDQNTAKVVQAAVEWAVACMAAGVQSGPIGVWVKELGYPSDLGVRVRRARQRARLSLDGMSKRLDISASQLDRIETGRVTSPSKLLVARIAGAANVAVAELLWSDMFGTDGGVAR